MSREAILIKTIGSLSRLPDSKLQEVADFADFLMSQLDSGMVTDGIAQLASGAKTFKFLEEEEELYSLADLKERFR